MSRSRERVVLSILFAGAAMFAFAGCGDDDSTGPVEDTEVSPGDISTVAGNGVAGLSPDGLAPTQTALYTPVDLTISPEGIPHILDFNNHRVRTIEGGVIHTVIGTGSIGDAPEGLPATQVNLNHPTNIIFDGSGQLILAAWHNSKIMRLDQGSGNLMRFAGDGSRAYADSCPALSCKLDLPVGLALDPSNGDIYVSDEANVRIRRINGSNGWIHTICGKGRPGGYTGDGGPAIDAELNMPSGQSAPPVGRVAFANGQLYIADYSNHAIRRINVATGIIDTFAGNGMAGFSGDGGPATAAQLNSPSDVDVDDAGNVYIADTYNSVIRKVDTNGVITTFAGTYYAYMGDGSVHFSGDFGPATAAFLDRPHGIAIGPEGDLWIADTYNNRIRKVWN